MTAVPAARPFYFWPGVAAITAIYFVLALSRISEIPLIDPDEPRYASAGRTMSRGGPESSLLIPEFNGEPRINKPPLFYWLVAFSNKIAGGSSEASSRMPSVVMGLLMLWGTVWLGAKMFGHLTGLLAGMILMTTPLVVALSRSCITDMTFSTFLAGAFAALMLAMTGAEKSRRWGWIAAFFLGLAVLTKATPALSTLLGVALFRAFELPAELRPRAARWIPTLLSAALVFSALALFCENSSRKAASASRAKAVAVVQKLENTDRAATALESFDQELQSYFLAEVDRVLNGIAMALVATVLVVVLWMAWRSERRNPTLPRMWKAGLAAALLMGLWWYGMLIVEQGWPRFKTLLSFELGSRLAGSMHREGFHFYLLFFPAVFFPWAIGLPASLRAAWPNQISSSDEQSLQTRADTFLLSWLLGVVFFFSIPGSKIESYVLPAMPAAALLVARYLAKLHSTFAWSNVTRGLAVVTALVIITLPIYGQWLPAAVAVPMAANISLVWAGCVLLAVLFGGTWILATHGHSTAAAIALSVGTALMFVLGSPLAVDILRARSTKDVCMLLGDSLRKCERVDSLGVPVGGLSFYLDRRINEHFWKPPTDKKRPAQILFDLLGDKESAALFIDQRYYPRLFGPGKKLAALTSEQITQDMPPELEFLFADERFFVVRNRIKN